MLIRRGGAIKSGEITGREVYLSRRELMVGAVALAIYLPLLALMGSIR